MEPRLYQRIALIKPCCIGDCVMSLPALQTLAARFASAAIDVYVGAHSRAVFEGRADVASIQPVADIPTWRHLPGLARRLRSGRHDLIVVLDRSRYVQLAARLSGAGEITLLERDPDNSRHEIDLCLDAIKALGIEPVTAMPELHISDSAAARARAFADALAGPYAVLHPGGAQNPGSMMPSKRWPLDNWTALASWVRDEGFQVVLTGSPAERIVCERVRAASGERGIHIAAGDLDLRESAAVIARACLYVGPDTGLSHMAAATGTPTIAIFGPTNPVRYAPRGPRVRVLAPAESSSLPSVDLRTLQKPRPEIATARVSVADVIDTCREMLAGQESAR